MPLVKRKILYLVMTNQLMIGAVIRAAAIVTLLSFVAWGTWLYEIVEIIGWPYTKWLTHTIYSPYIITFFAAFGYSIPFLLTTTVKTGKILIVLFLLYIVNIAFFEVSRFLCYILYCRQCLSSAIMLVFFITLAFSLFPLFGLVYWWITNKYIMPCKRRVIAIIAIFAFLMLPLSMVTIWLFPGLGTGTDWVDAVKMGYPVFWVIILLGISGIAVNTKMKIF